MKLLLALFAFTAFSTSALAHPGGHQLVCKSAKNSGSTQKINLFLNRSNGTGWYAPTIEVNINEHKFQLTTPDENNNYGTTFHNSPLKVITVNANVPTANHTNSGIFSIVAIPETVKAFTNDNKPIKWSLKAESEECNDSNGKANFQAVIHGSFIIDDTEVPTEKADVDTQVLDCELTYNSGMAC